MDTKSRDTKTWKPLSALELKYRKVRWNLARNLAVGSKERERERERARRKLAGENGERTKRYERMIRNANIDLGPLEAISYRFALCQR